MGGESRAGFREDIEHLRSASPLERLDLIWEPCRPGNPDIRRGCLELAEDRLTGCEVRQRQHDQFQVVGRVDANPEITVAGIAEQDVAAVQLVASNDGRIDVHSDDRPLRI